MLLSLPLFQIRKPLKASRHFSVKSVTRRNTLMFRAYSSLRFSATRICRPLVTAIFWPSNPLCSSCPLGSDCSRTRSKLHHPVARRDNNCLSGKDFAIQKLHRQRVLNQRLNCALERVRTKTGIVPLARQQFSG